MEPPQATDAGEAVVRAAAAAAVLAAAGARPSNPGAQSAPPESRRRDDDDSDSGSDENGDDDDDRSFATGTASQQQQLLMQRKSYTITKARERWSDEEHERFVEALKAHGRSWRKIEGKSGGGGKTVQDVPAFFLLQSQ